MVLVRRTALLQMRVDVVRVYCGGNNVVVERELLEANRVATLVMPAEHGQGREVEKAQLQNNAQGMHRVWKYETARSSDEKQRHLAIPKI